MEVVTAVCDWRVAFPREPYEVEALVCSDGNVLGCAMGPGVFARERVTRAGVPDIADAL